MREIPCWKWKFVVQLWVKVLFMQFVILLLTRQLNIRPHLLINCKLSFCLKYWPIKYILHFLSLDNFKRPVVLYLHNSPLYKDIKKTGEIVNKCWHISYLVQRKIQKKKKRQMFEMSQDNPLKILKKLRLSCPKLSPNLIKWFFFIRGFCKKRRNRGFGM